VVNLHAKYEVSSLNGSQDMEGPQNLQVGHVTPLRPVNKGSLVTPYLNSPTQICLITIQFSWRYDED